MVQAHARSKKRYFCACLNSNSMWREKADRIIFGIIIGLIGPGIGIWAYALALYIYEPYRSPLYYFLSIYHTPGTWSGALAISLIFNLPLLLLAFQLNLERLARGILSASIVVYVPIVVYLKFF
ncbi:MAG: hypothetical protein AAGB22_04895 [Bacteroidota bacterium]